MSPIGDGNRRADAALDPTQTWGLGFSITRKSSLGLHTRRITVVACGIPLLVPAHRCRKRHEHPVLTDPLDEAGWL